MAVQSLTLQIASISGGCLNFASPSAQVQALETGCFYLEMPRSASVDALKRFAQTFYREAGVSPGPNGQDYSGFKKYLDVYFDRERYQTEHVLLNDRQQRLYLPQPVQDAASVMSKIGHQCLKGTLAAIGLPAASWEAATAGATAGRAVNWLAVSHYRSERRLMGCAPHQDTGFITILYIEQEGLEAFSNGEWVSILPKPGHFVVNFGAALEHLTADWRYPVNAILHRVTECPATLSNDDRTSFATFVNPKPDECSYRLSKQGIPVKTGSVESFLRDFNKLTWNDNHTEFGIE